MKILGPKFMRSPARRGAAAAHAQWVLRLVFVNGYYVHIGKQSTDRVAVNSLASNIRDLMENE